MDKYYCCAKTKESGSWKYGYPIKGSDGWYLSWESAENWMECVEVIPETICRYTGVDDKNGKHIFEGAILKYDDDYAFTCYGVAKIGTFTQEFGYGEYSAECYGSYAEVKKQEYFDWVKEEDKEFFEFPDYWRVQNLLMVSNSCEVVGNIFDDENIIGKEGDVTI